MPTLEITGPDGKTIELEAPEGATRDQINAKVAEIKTNWSKMVAPSTTATGAFVTGLGQSLFGLGDEIEAGVRAALDPDKTYGDVLPEVRARVDASAEQHPIAYYGGEIGGALAVPGGLAKIGLQSATKLAANQGLKAITKAGIKEGAAYGAAHGFGRTEGGVQERIEGAVGGGLTGGALGGAAPVAIAGVQAAAQPVMNLANAIRQPTQEAARRIMSAQAADNAAQAAGNAALGAPNPAREAVAQNLVSQGRAGQELRNIDAGGENVRALARSAANNSPEAREILQRMTSDRFEGQAPRTIEFIRNLTRTSPGSALAAKDGIKSAAKAANDPLYRAALTAGDRPLWSPELERLTGSPLVREAMQKAIPRGKDRAIAEGYGAFNPGVKVENGVLSFAKGPNGVPTYPNLQYWDEVKRQVDAIGKQAQQAGDTTVASNAGTLVKNLRAELDKMVPAYQQARGTAAQYFGVEDALEAGEKFAAAAKSFNNEEVRQLFNKMTTVERHTFRKGFVSRYLTNLENSPDRRNILARVANSPAERQKLEIALGPNRARELEAFLHIEQIMDLPRTALGNSTTARQLVELGLAGGAGMLASGGNLSDPTTYIVGALTKYGANRGQQVIDQRMARRIAEMLVSKDPQVLQTGIRQVAANGSAMKALRQVSQVLAQGGKAGGGALIGGSMAQDAEVMP